MRDWILDHLSFFVSIFNDLKRAAKRLVCQFKYHQLDDGFPCKRCGLAQAQVQK